MTELVPAARWLRVSTTDQDHDNQIPDVERFAAHHGYDVRMTFQVDDSAWKDDTGGPEYRAELKRALDAAHQGHFRILIVWAIDRITRLGAEDTLRLVRKFRERGVMLVSVQESWLNGSPEIGDLLLAFAGWQAQQESRRKSARVKIALAKRRAAGLPIGRQHGAVDKSPRKRSGYVKAWESGGARRKAAG